MQRLYEIPNCGEDVACNVSTKFPIVAKTLHATSLRNFQENQTHNAKHMNHHLTTTREYHQRTKHHPQRFARSLGYMDWATQPHPFRRYEGATLLPLDEIPPTPTPSYDALFHPNDRAVQPFNRHTISQLLYDSLALSAWKEYYGNRWSLRVNPSSGNLHPTEGYVLVPPIDGISDNAMLCHYAPFEHGLEVRRTIDSDEWQALTTGLPTQSLLVGLSSIYWREAWKYGERAFRYCQHDVGHALAAISIAAAVLGWQVRLLESIPDNDLAVLLGIHNQQGIEAEHPDCLVVLFPHDQAFPPSHQQTYHLPSELIARWQQASFEGIPNQLSHDHYHWDIIDTVSAATVRDAPPPSSFWHARDMDIDNVDIKEGDSAFQPRSISARQIIRQRRSAVDMDGKTSISQETFYHILQRTMPSAMMPPFATLPWKPAVHLVLFVHRVQGVAPGLYLLVRDTTASEQLKTAMAKRDVVWQRPSGCPSELPLFLLMENDFCDIAKGISCHQDIASDGVFSLGMLVEFEETLQSYGAWFYRRLYWETGMIGQMLYLEAEAAGIRATGIGCFLDDVMHQLLGLQDTRYQSLYHLTLGMPVEDSRLRTLAAYEHLQA